MHLVLVGHSWVSKLRDLGIRFIYPEGVRVRLSFIGIPGGRYANFLDNRALFDQVASLHPDFVVVILAGNSILDTLSSAEVVAQLREFYGLLREKVPEARIIATHPEQRYYGVGNKWKASVGEEYHSKRNIIINVLNRLKCKDHVLRISGANRLDDQNWYQRDGVHLTVQGYRKLLQYITDTVAFSLRKGSPVKIQQASC